MPDRHVRACGHAPAAKRGSYKVADEADDGDNLSSLKLDELRERCQKLGLPAYGKKAELVRRIQNAVGQQQQQQQEEEGLEEEEEEEEIGEQVTEGQPTDAAQGDQGFDDIDYDELVGELEVELSSYSKEDLLQCLQDRSLSTQGAKKELVQRLAMAVAEESLYGAQDPSGASGAQQPVPAAPAGPGAPASAGYDLPDAAADPSGSSLPAVEREYLLADKQQALLDELLGMGVSRQELVEILEDLAERASWLLAEEEVLLMEQQAATTGQTPLAPSPPATAAAGLADSPSSILDSINATDVNKMKVEELRDYLRRLGLSDEGGRYTLRDRLMTMLVVRRAATAGDMDYLLRQLSQMTLGELRSELERRSLDISGSKAALETRLAQVLVEELVGEQPAAAIAGLTSEAEQEQEVSVGVSLLEEYDEVLTAVEDPAVTIALICGTPQASSSSSSSLPIPNSYQVHQLTHSCIAATTPADLAATLPALATATFADVAELARHLAANQVHAAFSALPGGALAMSGSLAVACEAAGVVLAAAGSPAALQDQQPVQPVSAAPVMQRAAALQELQRLGYVTLPMLQITRAEVEQHQQALEGWLNSVQQETEEMLAAVSTGMFEPSDEYGVEELAEADDEDKDDAAEEEEEEEDEEEGNDAEPEQALQPTAGSREALSTGSSPGNGGSGGGGNVSSPLLKAWTAARYEQHSSGIEESPVAEAEQPSVEELLAALPEFVQKLAGWCIAEGMHPEMQVFSIGRPEGGELLCVGRGCARLVTQILLTFAQDPLLQELLVEPLHPQLTRWEILVVSSPEDGPVALVPAEVEQYSTLQELTEAHLALREWQLMQEGQDPDVIAETLEVMSAAEPVVLDALRWSDLPDPLPRNTLKLHVPPRTSNKITQTIRHTAAKAVAQLGLQAAGVVRVGGWLAVRPDWQERYTLPPEAIQKMPDYDARQLARMAQDELAARQTKPLPLADYYDEAAHLPDLTLFDPSKRCQADQNGEGEVFISHVEVDVPLHPCSLAGMQAAEIGLGLGGLVRHLINVALAHADKQPLLPPAPRPDIISSMQWAQASGANDTVKEIQVELALQAVKEREDLETLEQRMEEEERQAAFAALPMEEQVLEVLDALTAADATQKQLMAPREEPEEWTAEFDARSLEEIHAERDALRTPEDLAARDLRDEGLYTYGDQPISYDRWDSGDDWVPPGIVQAEAAAAGLPVPSVAELQQQELDRQAVRQEELQTRQYSPEDKLPDVTDDEVYMGRMLGLDRYKGGVEDTIKRRLAEKGKAAAAAAAAGAVSTALAGPGSQAADDAEEALVDSHWPWPSDQELLTEVAARRGASRVWVLMGGDGLGRQESLRSGANIWAKLQRCCDLQVDAFLLPPAGAGISDTKRRSELLAQRTEWRALGIPENMYPDSMKDSTLIDMPPSTEELTSRTVIVMQPQLLARSSVEEATEAAQRAAARASQVYHAAPVQSKQQLEAMFMTHSELDAYMIEGVGAAWGGTPGELPPAPRFMDLQEFVTEAVACNATVILTVHDATASSGQLQAVADLAETLSQPAVTSASAVAADLQAAGLSDVAAADEVVVEDADDAVGLIPLPRKVIKTAELAVYLQKPEELQDVFEALLSEWEEAGSICIKPPAHSGTSSVAHIHNGDDLMRYMHALHTGLPRIPAGTLTNQHKPVTLPLYLPELMVVEPWVETDPVKVTAEAGGKVEVQWEGSSRWVEVNVGLIGELGSMVALTPTMIAHSAQGEKHQLTPPPEHIVPAAALEAAKNFAVVLADGLGLRSIASVQGFVNVDTGEMVVLDVNPFPHLTDGSCLLQQVQHLEWPLLPYQLYRGLAKQAFITAWQAQEKAAAAVSDVSSAYYSPPSEPGSAGFTSQDFDLGGVDGGAGLDIFGGAADPAGGGTAPADGEEGDSFEDADMEGIAAGYAAYLACCWSHAAYPIVKGSRVVFYDMFYDMEWHL
eukprot:gene2565-2867_t